VGIFGRASLYSRIEILLTNRDISARVSLSRAAGCALGLLLLAMAASRVPNWIAFAQQTERPSFEVASVKVSNLNAGGRNPGPRVQSDHGNFVYSDTLLGLIVRAYGLLGCNGAIRRGEDCPMVSGGPDWIKRDKFNVQAKAPDGTPDYTGLQFLTGQAPQLELMLQRLLEDRFNLRVHQEIKNLDVYVITTGKNGPKLQKGQETNRPGVLFIPEVDAKGEGTMHMTVRNSSMLELANTFADILGRPVLDRTGIEGKFDLTMDYAANAEKPGPVTEIASRELFPAFLDQAGLRFDSTRAAVQVLLIDHAEKPSGN
jgi:uncharacterized protein (TIGR03435 family)